MVTAVLNASPVREIRAGYDCVPWLFSGRSCKKKLETVTNIETPVWRYRQMLKQTGDSGRRWEKKRVLQLVAEMIDEQEHKIVEIIKLKYLLVPVFDKLLGGNKCFLKSLRHSC